MLDLSVHIFGEDVVWKLSWKVLIVVIFGFL